MNTIRLENLIRKNPLRGILGSFSFASVKTINPSPGVYHSPGHFRVVPNTGKTFKKGFEDFSRREVKEEYLDNLKTIHFNLRFFPDNEEVLINTKMDYMMYRTDYPVKKIKNNLFVVGGGGGIFPRCAVSNSKKVLDDYFNSPDRAFINSYVLINGLFRKEDYL